MPEEVSGSGGTAPPAVSSRLNYEQRIQEAQNENLRLRARERARGIVTEDLALAVLGPLTIHRLSEELMQDLPMVNGELDVTALRDRITRKRDLAEMELGEALNMYGHAGQPHGLGGSVVSESTGRAAEFDSATEAALSRTFGLSEEAAKTAVRGR